MKINKKIKLTAQESKDFVDILANLPAPNANMVKAMKNHEKFVLRKKSESVDKLSSSVDAAREFAFHSHGTQMYGSHPYVYHLNQVAKILMYYGYSDDEYLVVAYFHDLFEDVPEDKSAAIEFIQSNFPEHSENIIRALEAITDNPGKNRAERKKGVLERVAKDPIARIVKLADRIANLTECVAGRFDKEVQKKIKMYLTEDEEFQAELWDNVATNGIIMNYSTMFKEIDNLIEFLEDFLDNEPV